METLPLTWEKVNETMTDLEPIISNIRLRAIISAITIGPLLADLVTPDPPNNLYLSKQEACLEMDFLRDLFGWPKEIDFLSP